MFKSGLNTLHVVSALIFKKNHYSNIIYTSSSLFFFISFIEKTKEIRHKKEEK